MPSDDTMNRNIVARKLPSFQFNGYPRGFVKKAIEQQIKKRINVKLPKEEDEAGKMANASISFIEGIFCQEVRRIAQVEGVECISAHGTCTRAETGFNFARPCTNSNKSVIPKQVLSDKN